MSKRTQSISLIIGLGLWLSACAAGPSYPLLTPLDVARGFGYADFKLPDGRYEVSYVAPPLAGFGYRFDQEPVERQARSLAYDMAIWRAAQIAEAQGFAGFAVADTKSNADIQQFSGAYGDPWGPWGPAWGSGPHGGWRRGPYGWNSYYPPETSVQVEVKLAVTLSNSLKPGDYNAADAIQQLRATYPGADGAGAAPGTAAAGPLGSTVTPVLAPTSVPKT